VLGWLLVLALVIIWSIFLFPFLRRRRSPVKSVEEFEQKMDFLAETHVPSRGRWVLTPRKEERFLGDRGRTRSRVRERRRQVLVALLEATGLALLIGLFPPFHRILLGAAVLGGLLLVYTALLIRIRIVETHRAELRRARRSASRRAADPYAAERGRAPAPAMAYQAAASNGARTRRAAPVDAHVDDWRTPVRVELAAREDDDPVLFIDDDVHLVVHRSGDLDLAGLRAAAVAR